MTNDFLPFCATDTGTNLENQSTYLVDPNRAIGNQPGIASSQFLNKALRQSTYVAANLAQYISNFSNVSVLDNATPAQILAQIASTFQPLSPILTNFLSGTGTWNATHYFFIASGNATVGATYTNNAVTFTVVTTISSGTVLQATGSGAPSAGGGTLTKSSGTGDSTLTFYASRMATYLVIQAVGGGGGGAGGGSSNGGTGGSGNTTSFGTSLITVGGGTGGTGSSDAPGSGGSATLGTGPVGLALVGATGGGGHTENSINSITSGGMGGSSPFGGAGGNPGNDAVENTGSGGGGGTAGSLAGGAFSGGGGGAGGYVNAMIIAPNSNYPYVIGSGGGGGSAGSTGGNGGAGGDGLVQVIEYFQ
jgi:hypothetical protein